METGHPQIDEFRKNAVRQPELLQILQNPTLQVALSIVSEATKLGAIKLDAPEIVSVRAAALARGAERFLEILYLLSSPLVEAPELPDATYEPPTDEQ